MIVMGRGQRVQSGNRGQFAPPYPMIHHHGGGPGMRIEQNEAMMERVLIVDDHPLVRDGLRSVIAVSFDGCEIFEASSMEEAMVTLGKQSNFDLVLLDVNIPDVKRLDGLKLLRNRHPILPVVMVSGSFDRAIVREALAAGAAGFIPKSIKRSAIVEALHRVVSGEIYMPDAIEDSPQENAEEAEILAKIESLTPQQRIVLTHLVHGRLNKQIAHDLTLIMKSKLQFCGGYIPLRWGHMATLVL